MGNKRHSVLHYRIAQAASLVVAKLIFRRKMIRNEIKGKKGPFVVIANHEAALDFVNLIGVTHVPMTFVISNSIYSTLPIKKFVERMGVIPKQQFQTSIRDIKRMKEVIDEGGILVIYPAGLMCEDGRSTPLPAATYQFLKWIRADIYVARTSGTYFTMPKWTSGMRAGRTYLDIYRLFSREEIEAVDDEAVRRATEGALSFDAYREQEELLVKYRKNSCIEGLENVLYQCPHCGEEFTVRVHDRSTLRCDACGFAHTSDAYGFLHNSGGIGKEWRYVSDWSRYIYDALKARIEQGEDIVLQAATEFRMVDGKRNKFIPVGKGTVTLTREAFLLKGSLRDEPFSLIVPIHDFASLPFKPGRHFEVQCGNDIYRCVLEDGRMAMKFINMVKACYELEHMSHTVHE